VLFRSPATLSPDGGSRWLVVVSWLLEDPTNPWWDDRRTINLVESRDEILLQALTAARNELTQTLGKNPEDWRWSQLHVVAPQHPVLGADVPAPLQWFANPGPVGVGGGSSIVNATGWDAGAENDGRRDYSVTAVPSMRMVVDLGDLDRSLWVNFTGVSGHPASAYYSDQLEAWAPGRPSPGPSAATPSRRPRGRPAPCAPPAADRQATPPGGGGQAPAEKEEPVRRNHRSSVMTASTGWSCSARGSRSSVMSSATWTME